MLKGNSIVYILDSKGGYSHEQERSFYDSYYRVIELSNTLIEKGYVIHSFGGTRLRLYSIQENKDVRIGHSNGIGKGKTYIYGDW